MAVLIPFWTLCSCCLLFWATADWVVQLSSAGEDKVGGVAVDSAANPIVAVSSTSAVVSGPTLFGQDDIFLLKYNADGTLQSQWSFGTTASDVASSIIVDSSDNIFVAGTTEGAWPGQSQTNSNGFLNMVLFKLDSAGSQQWAVQVGDAFWTSVVSCAALDSAQNVILGGSVAGDMPGFTNAGLYDLVIFKFDSTGSQLWAFQIGTSLLEIAGGLAVDSSDNIIMCGYGMVLSGDTGVAFDGNTVFGDSDIFVFKLTSTGSKAWSDQFGGSGADLASDVAVDSSDNIYVTGTVTGQLVGATGQGGLDACVIKYNNNGVRQWVKQIGTASDDGGDQIVIDSDTLYVSGSTNGDFHGTNAGGFDYFVVRMDTAGNEISGEQYGTDKWEGQVLHVGGSYPRTTLSHDASGNIYAMGTVFDLSGTSHDAFLWKIATTTTTTTTTATSTATSTATASTTSTTSTATPRTSTATTATSSINTDSTTADLVVQLSSAGEDKVGGVAVDSAANPIVAVSSTSAVVSGLTLFGQDDIFLLKYNADGTLQSQWSFGTAASDVASSIIVDSSDNIFVAGTTEGAWPGQSQTNSIGSSQIVLFKLDSAGSQQWAVQVDISNPSVSSVALDSAQNVVLAGTTMGDLPGFSNAGGLWDFFILKFDSTGSQLWAFQIGTSVPDVAGGLAVDSSDNIILCGFGVVTTGETGVAFDGNTAFGETDIFVFKLTSTGSKAWSDQFGGSGADLASDVAVDSSDNIYVTGTVTGQLVGATGQGNTDAFVIKYNNNGVRQWVKQIGTAYNDGGDQIVIDSDTLYVSGPTSGDFHGTNAGGVDYFVVRMDTAGNEISGAQYGTDKEEYQRTSSRTTLTRDASGNIYAMGTVSDNDQTYYDTFLWKTKIDTTTTTTSLNTDSTTTLSASTTSEAEEQVLLSAEEVEALETQRKEQAALTVAAIDAAVDAAVQQALPDLFGGNADTSNPGVLGEVSVQSPVGPVKVASFSEAKLAAAGGVATVSAGDGNESAGAGASATLEVNSALLGEVGGNVLLSAASLTAAEVIASFKTDHALAETKARRLASQLRSELISVNFRDYGGNQTPFVKLQEILQPAIRGIYAFESFS